MKRLWISLGMALLVAVGVVSYSIGRAGAYGIPQSTTMAFSGSLLTFGVPDNATHSMSVSLYVNEADGGPGSGTAACSTSTQSVATVNGQFSVPLTPACVTVIHQNPNVSAQVTIDTVPMGLSSLTAVPYTVEADTASNAAPGSPLAALAPPGAVTWFSGTGGAPSGWLVADGSLVSRTTYAALFAAVGTTYGAGDGSTTFALPNLVSRFPMGVEPASLGTTGGVASINWSHTHTASTMTTKSGTGVHVHDLPWGDAGGGMGWDRNYAHDTTVAYQDLRLNSYDSGGNSWNPYQAQGGDHIHTMVGSTDAAGSTAQESRPPFIGLVPIVKY